MVLRNVGNFLLYSAAGCVALILVLLLAVKLALDRAPQYQAEIKDWVHERTGYPIEFAHVSPAFRWYGPELYFERLEVRSKDGKRELARAAGGRIGVDVWQFIRSGKLFAGRVELDAPNILVARIGPDKFALASEIVLGGGDASQSLKLDDLPAGTLAIKQGVVTLKDWNSAVPRLELRDVNLQLRRGDGGVAFKADARLPAVLGGLIALNATAKGEGYLDTLKWSAHGRTQDLSFTGWRQLLPESLARLGGGSGGFEVAANGQGATLAHADIDFAAKNVVTRLTDEPGVNFEQISGLFSVTHARDRWTLTGRHVQALRAGRRDPESEFDASWRGGDEGLLELQARASYLRAEALLPLAGLLPQKDLRERLQDTAPTGEWRDTHVDLKRMTAREPWQLDVQAQFREVGFAPARGSPGLRGLSGTLAGTADGGRVDIETQRGIFTWPTEFPQPVALENFKTTLYWKRTPDEFLVASPSVDLKTRDATVHARLAWHQPVDGGSPVLVLASTVDNGSVANTRLYLPRTHIAPSGMTWLNRAFLAGRLAHADVVIEGPIRNYPFRDGTGLFLARAHFDGMTLDYKEGWPLAENLEVLAEFRNEGLNVKLVGGHIGNLHVEAGDARFADFKTAELQVHATTTGDARDMLGYLSATPLDALAEHAFSSVAAKGPMQTDVDLFLPFKDFDHRRTLVHAHLHGVSLNRVGSPLAATELTGDADIDGAQASRADIHGKVLGGSFQMQARAPRNRPVTRTILVFSGTFSGEALHSALSLPPSIPLAGTTDWRGVLRMAPEPARERSLRLSGSLAGLDLNLPEPLAKPAGRALPSSVEIQWPVSGSPLLRFAVGSVVRGQVALDSDADGPKLGRAAVTFGSGSTAADSAFSDSQVVNTGGAIERLDLGGWLKLYAPDKSAKPLGSFLRSARFEVARIDYLGLTFLDVAVELASSDAGWRIGIGGPNVVGSITLPGAADSAQPWKLEFERLKFVDGLAGQADGQDQAPAEGEAPGQAPAPGQARRSSGSGSAPTAAANPRGIPDINFHAADMIWGERQFGDVAATLAKLDDGVSLKQLTVTAANFSASAKGEWRGQDAGVARVEGTLSSTDVGATMKDLGYDAVIEAKTGKVDFDMSWLGAPTGEALSVSTGHVRVALDKGQLTSIKPGAGRVVGLASLAALPRRLELDFSDLTDKGLAFDTASGNFDLRDGSAFTNDVLVKGPAAEIGLIGRVGLKNHDYDQTAVVTGNVSSTLPLAAFAAGPIIGGAVLLFTQVFKQPLKGLTRGYYRITGSWDNPTVERIKSADAAAATVEASK